MTPFLEHWSQVAASILEQALETTVVLMPGGEAASGASFVVFGAEVTGDMEGRFLVKAEKQAIQSLPRPGAEAVLTLWPELFERIAAAVVAQLASQRSLQLCSIATEEPETGAGDGVPFMLTVGQRKVQLLLVDGAQRKSVRRRGEEKETVADADSRPPQRAAGEKPGASSGRGMDLLLDVELEASLRFGSREMPLSEIVELGPGDVVQLDRHVADPVDLIVGDKIVARGEVVLVNGNFGLRVTEVSEPQKRLESIRCLF